MNFGEALEVLKKGGKAKRNGWNGKNQYIVIVKNLSYITPGGKIENPNHDAIGNQAIAFVGTSGIQVGWLASQADMLAEDWEAIDFDGYDVHVSNLTFGEAVRAMKYAGKKVRRRGWNGKGMFVVYQKGYPNGIPANKNTSEAWGIKEGDLFICEPYLQMKNVQGHAVMWTATNADILAEDWQIVGD